MARGVPMSNVDRLVQAGLVELDALSPTQLDFLNNVLTTEEIDNLISIGQKFMNFQGAGGPPGGYSHLCTWTVTV